jgi:hypothetical protein
MTRSSIITIIGAITGILLLSLCGCEEYDSIPVLLKAPADLKAAALSDSEIALTWDDTSKGETHFSIEYAADTPSGFILLEEVPAETTSYTAENLDSDRTYYFRMYTVKGKEASGYSSTASAKTLRQPGFIINNGEEVTNNPSVMLIITMTGSMRMRFSNDGTTWSSWEPYAGSKAWTLLSGEGLRTVYGEFDDGNGSVSLKQASITVDTTAPQVTLFVINNDNPKTGTPAVTLSMSITDADFMRFSNSTGRWSSWEPYEGIKIWVLSAGDGQKQVDAEFSDNAGNVSRASDTIILDTQGPVVLSFEVQSNANHVNTTSVVILMNVTDADEMRFSNDKLSWSSWESYSSSKNWTLTQGDGVKYVYGEFRDNIGHTAESSDDVNLDTLKPVITSFLIEKGDPWVNTVSVTLDSIVSGASHMRFRNDDSSSWSAWYTYGATYSWTLTAQNGVKKVHAEYSDLAGNVVGSDDTILLDTIPPAVSLFTINNGDTYTSSGQVTLSIRASDAVSMRFQNDNISGWSSWVSYSSQSPWTLLSQNGNRTVYAEFRDSHDNVAAVNDTIIFDDRPPQLSYFRINNNDTYTTSSNATLTSIVSGAAYMRIRDDAVGWSSWTAYNASVSWQLPTGDGTKRVFAEFRDEAGNTIDADDSIILDTTSPVIATFVINNGASETISRGVTLTLSVSGGSFMRLRNSGSSWTAWETLASSRSWTLPSGEGTKVVNCEVKDDAGNVSTASDTIILDEYRTVRVTFDRIHVTSDGDSIGNGELYWSFETGIEQSGNTTPIASYTIDSRTSSQALSISDNSTYTVGRSQTFTFQQLSSYKLFVTCWVKEDDSPLSPDNAGSFKEIYGLPTWGAGSTRTHQLSGDGVTVTISYTISELN